MTNFLYQLPTKIILDGYGTEFEQRQKLQINDTVIVDDPINHKTIVTISGAGSSATLSQILSNGNNATNQTITGLGSPVFDQDAATKAYVDANSGGNIYVTLAKGNDADGYAINDLSAIQLRSVTAPTHTTGNLYYDTDLKALSFQTDQTGVSLQIGEEIYLRVVNNTGSTITDGSVVYVNGVQGNRPTVALASNASSTQTLKTIGVATQNILNNQEGLITTYGVVRGFNTSGFSNGDVLYLGSTAGTLTNVKPTGKSGVTRIGFALNSTNNGSIQVTVHQPSVIADAIDVNEGQPNVDGYHLISADGYWTRSNFITDVANAIANIEETNTVDGTVPTGSDGYLVVQVAPANKQYNLSILNKDNKKWSKVSLSVTGDGWFSFNDDFDVYTDRSRLLANGIEIRIVTDINYTYLYIWKKTTTQNFRVVLTKDIAIPTWSGLYAGTITSGSSYVTIGNIPLTATYNGIFQYMLWASTNKKCSVSDVNVKVESALSSYCSTDGIDDYASSFERFLPNGKWIKFNRSGQNIEIQLKQDGSNYNYNFSFNSYVEVS